MVAKNHYDDCPYGCNQNGMLLDTNSGNLVPCPHCSEKKRELLRKGFVETEEDEVLPLSTVLGIENQYLTSSFVYDVVVPDGEKLFLDEESIMWQSEESEKMYLDLTIGELPPTSMCFGLGVKGRIDRFAYPMLAKAYLGGLSIGRFISCTEFCRLQLDTGASLDEFYSPDFLMMLINEGCCKSDLASAKGLMQTRALKGKPTVFVSTWTVEACSVLLGFSDDCDYFLAKPVFLKYKAGKSSKHTKYIDNILGVENNIAGDESSEEGGIGISMSDLV